MRRRYRFNENAELFSQCVDDLNSAKASKGTIEVSVRNKKVQVYSRPHDAYDYIYYGNSITIKGIIIREKDVRSIITETTRSGVAYELDLHGIIVTLLIY